MAGHLSGIGAADCGICAASVSRLLTYSSAVGRVGIAMVRKPWKVLFAIAEAYPFIKVGGLADVGGSLPKALARLGHDVRLVLPRYSCVEPGKPVASFEAPMGPEMERVRIAHHGVHGGVDVYTVGSERYFDRETVYGGYEDDDIAPFVLLCKAVVEFAAFSGWKPDIIHCNDWHLGLIPRYARSDPYEGALAGTRTVLTIHNLAYQGRFGPETESLTGLEDGESGMLAWGIACADTVNTVSRSYREEILSVEHGMGMDGLLRSRMGDLYGILNGVDYEVFDPCTDPHITAHYDRIAIGGKRRNKAALQLRSGLDLNQDVPLLGMVARLVDQKGIDLLCGGMDEIVALGAQVVIMGQGDEYYERELEEAALRHAGAVAYHAVSGEEMARQLYAGSDLFLAPSTFEPCGLGPLIALRYGSIPVVRRTGGLTDTIRDHTHHPESGLGFTFTHRSPRSLVNAVKRALETYRRKGEWRALQKRAMAANFSWESAGREYELLYARALAGRRPTISFKTKDAIISSRVPRTGRTRTKQAVPLALVHHANQYLLADHYDNREGITEIVEGYTAALRLHEKYGIPATLHLSGTLIETLAWHYPWFLDLVRGLREKGLISLIGGTYSENVMPLFDASFNKRQLDEFFWLCRHHLRCPPEELEVCWVPERVWDTEKLAPVLTDDNLANGGYRFVLLDDRLLYPTHGSYQGSPRASFDAAGPYNSTTASRSALRYRLANRRSLAETYQTYRIAGANDLTMVPLSADLRYWIPPAFPEHWRYLKNLVEALCEARREEDPLLVYADDLENTAGVGGWDASSLGRYDAFLRWVASRVDIAPVSLPEWLAGHPPRQERRLKPGTFFELAHQWQAGEDYLGRWESAAWAPYKELLLTVQDAVRAAQREGGDRRLLDLAWKHFLASTYETAWYDPAEDGCAAAPWAKAIASHARACLVIADAARWFTRSTRALSLEIVDIDQDGEDEVILRNEHLYAVVAPGHGARIVYLFTLAPDGGALVIGNPTDDWNFQEQLNQYMHYPPNHPGALADAGFEDDCYRVSALETRACACVQMTNIQTDSPLFEGRKSVLLAPDSPVLAVSYQLSDQVGSLATETCLAPDYYRLLRESRRGLNPCNNGATRRGFRNGDVAVWLELSGDEETCWVEPARAEAGHGMNVRVKADASCFHLLIACGNPDENGCQELLQEHRRVLDSIGKEASTTDHARRAMTAATE
jgi:starch synthase